MAFVLQDELTIFNNEMVSNDGNMSMVSRNAFTFRRQNSSRFDVLGRREGTWQLVKVSEKGKLSCG